MRRLFNAVLLILLTGFFSLPARAVTTPIGDKNAEVSADKGLRAGEIKIIPELGRVKEKFDGGQDKLVVHIQDAHTNYEAQKNSAGMIEDLINKYGVYLILVEGGSRDVSLNRYREQFLPERRKEIAEESLKNGVIAGEEYLNIVSEYPMKLQGIEDRVLYDKNMMAFLEIDKARDSAILYTQILSSAVSSLKAKIYNKALKELDEKRIGFKQESVNLNDYVIYLGGLAGSKRINLAAYQSYGNLMSSIALEKAIDFPSVERERAEVIELISKKLGEDDLNELLMNSVDFKSGKLTQTQYHNYLKAIMTKAKLDIRKYPNLDQYTTYISTYEKIDSTNLFKELKSIEDAIEQTIVTNEEQKRLLRTAKDLELLIEFINLKLAPDDFDYYQENEADFNIPVWVRFLNTQLTKHRLTQKIPEGTQAIEKIIPSLKTFYIIARKRDEVFLTNTKKYMNEEGVNIAVLIAGGFHTPTLMKLFREDNISYVVVSPKVVKPTDEKLYHKILTEGWAPAEETTE